MLREQPVEYFSSRGPVGLNRVRSGTRPGADNVALGDLTAVRDTTVILHRRRIRSAVSRRIERNADMPPAMLENPREGVLLLSGGRPVGEHIKVASRTTGRVNIISGMRFQKPGEAAATAQQDI